MVSILTSGYSYTKECIQEEASSTRTSNIIQDLEKKLPTLPENEQAEMAARIASMKTAAKNQALSAQRNNTIIEASKFAAGKVLGPIGSGLGTLVSHDYQQKLKLENSSKIQKAKKVAGRRIKPRSKNSKPKTSAVKAAFKAASIGYVTSASGITEIAKSTLGWAYESAKSYVLG